MSLFQVHEWWRCSRIETEECGTGCMCVANIDNSTDDSDKIILGSYDGFLHIYAPAKVASIHDCLLEVNLQSPILQLAVGRFMSISADLHLAVLHPRLLTVYSFSATSGGHDQVSEFKSQKMYQHKLERSAANMTFGPFGGVKDRDFICVQSLDGTLSIFEHETFAFTRFLPGFLLPGPLAYTNHSDAYLTVSSSYILESYSYQVLAVASDLKTNRESQSVSGGKRINPDWTFNLGEYALEITVVEFPQKKPLIAVLGERSFFCFDCTGKLLFMRKFEDPVSCCKSSPSPDGKYLQTVVCTHSKKLLIFNDAKLKWAAKLDDVPIVVDTGTFSGFRGMLVMTNDQCQVTCQYLGTSPTVFSLPPSRMTNLSQDRLEVELDNTKRQILEHHSSAGDTLMSKKDKNDLKVTVMIPKALDKKSVAAQHLKSGDDGLPSITLQMSLKVARRITEVQIIIPVSDPLHASMTNLCIPAISEVEHSPTIRISFFLKNRNLPFCLEQNILVSYSQVEGIPQVVTSHVRLPLTLVAKSCAPVKKLDHRVTLESSKPCVNLMELFSDFVCDESGPNCVGVEYVNGAKATVLTSKTSNRYRIQCDQYEGLSLLTEELVHRVRQRYSDVVISSQEPPQLEEYVKIVDEHFRLRQVQNEIRLLLQQRAHQYRAIQRRLLTRFKDKTPQPLNCLDTLLEGTHTQLLALADAMEDNDNQLKSCCTSLSSVSRLLVLLTSLWRNFSSEEEDYLTSILSIDHTYNGSNAVGWEETVDAALTALLKTTLSRSDAQPFSVSMNSLDPPQDTVKIKKHLAILMDRLSKGSSLLPASKKSLTSSAKYDNSKALFKNPIDVASSPIHKPAMDAYDSDNLNDLTSQLPPEPEVRLPPKHLLTGYPEMPDELLLNGTEAEQNTPLDFGHDKYEADVDIDSYYNDDYSDILQ